jgi:hypothetical protein
MRRKNTGAFTTKESELAESKQISFKIHRFAVLKLF